MTYECWIVLVGASFNAMCCFCHVVCLVTNDMKAGLGEWLLIIAIGNVMGSLIALQHDWMFLLMGLSSALVCIIISGYRHRRLAKK